MPSGSAVATVSDGVQRHQRRSDGSGGGVVSPLPHADLRPVSPGMASRTGSYSTALNASWGGPQKTGSSYTPASSADQAAAAKDAAIQRAVGIITESVTKSVVHAIDTLAAVSPPTPAGGHTTLPPVQQGSPNPTAAAAAVPTTTTAAAAAAAAAAGRDAGMAAAMMYERRGTPRASTQPLRRIARKYGQSDHRVHSSVVARVGDNGCGNTESKAMTTQVMAHSSYQKEPGRVEEEEEEVGGRFEAYEIASPGDSGAAAPGVQHFVLSCMYYCAVKS
jgi:hypothetical protein